MIFILLYCYMVMTNKMITDMTDVVHPSSYKSLSKLLQFVIPHSYHCPNPFSMIYQCNLMQFIRPRF